MQSYRTNSSGELIKFHGDEICLITGILCDKLWGKIQINGRLHSERWWRNRLQDIFDEPDVIISPENLWDGKPAEPTPIPFEIEMGMPDLNYEILLKAWKKAFPNA